MKRLIQTLVHALAVRVFTFLEVAGIPKVREGHSRRKAP
jgi:hypothetical protein